MVIRFFLFTMLLSSPVSLLAQEVIYAGEERDAYHVRLLKLALSYSPEKNYLVKGYGEDLPKSRAFILMENNAGVDVMIATATQLRDERFLPIRFPILKGLNGWRIALVNKNRLDIFAKVKTLADLQAFIPGQFHFWTDTKILQNNGITVTKASNLEGLYKMVEVNRIDYFPRSILEVEQNYSDYQALDIAIEPYLVIRYPSAYYFYLNKNNHQLAADINKGLELALVDGSFDKLFIQTYGKVLDRLNVSKRRVIHLSNPFLVDTVPLHRKELWVLPRN